MPYITDSLLHHESGRQDTRSLPPLTQWSEQKLRYQSPGGLIEAAILEPARPVTQVPVLLAPGWAETMTVFRDCAAELVKAGRVVITLDHSRRGGTVEPVEPWPVDELRKANNILYVLEQLDVQVIDVVSHSEGSVNVTIAASLRPERFRNIVYFAPAGLIGEDAILETFVRFANVNLRNAVNALTDRRLTWPVARGLIEGAKYICRNPQRAFLEGQAVSRSDLTGALKSLHDKGIGLAIVHGVCDVGFPMSQMQEVLGHATEALGLDRTFLDGFLSVQGGHMAFYMRYKEYTWAADKLLTTLERKHRNHSEPSGDQKIHSAD
jgi:pimeloyl-ACP methyl ester carboxylesterase